MIYHEHITKNPPLPPKRLISASVTRKIDYLILIAPATTPLQITGYSKLDRIIDDRITKTGLSSEDFFRLMEPWGIEMRRLHNSKARGY
ncbi:MAG: hypothetical protein COW32_06640 [Candidatus Aquicultor secundus]|uniref:Uncharacterized protein n=1 Tax=Candidatus Aquicultor secundus TaxID=1973895 RepID=A0A2M7T6A5_9ACTN|nr:hypothetical protein [Candidatus Aquicultor secundus]NCO66566.1 hypothetical protein [Solirubrobacter sp.]OIO83435.1 MAG: hypothetical protein AUK32_10075 [Candidatus Aquicultor secundus]PIU27142.1 MAG: hypothetical protein COT10_05080 [Candidatus Aquicultor secundus]PIW22065.1 MAG: hypothetical protein COW32_06640 [Candidatus Aquicultor secundus]PIX52986.1 MAG: hypothetical protein COZ51_01200 [Candidatus Aquicultor secundus]